MKYCWQSNYTGEIVPRFIDVVTTVFTDVKNFGFSFNYFNWRYKKDGF